MFTLDEEDIAIIVDIASQITGMCINPQIHGVVFQNVIERMKIQGTDSFEEYLQVVDDCNIERNELISALTVHTTAWFRESAAFELLTALIVQIIREKKNSIQLSVLSVACSTGEEVFSIALVLEYLRQLYPLFDYSIEGWDIDEICIKAARSCRYSKNYLANIPIKYRHLVLLDESTGYFEMNSEIKKRCFFRKCNVFEEKLKSESYDVIFCRNVLYYFEANKANTAIEFIFNSLKKCGLFCCGVSESNVVRKFNKFEHFEQAIFKKRSENIAQVEVVVATSDSKLAWHLKSVFALMNCKLFFAETGEELLKITRIRAIQLVLISRNFDQKDDGFEISNVLKKRSRSVSIILLTHEIQTNMLPVALSHGIDEVVCLPMSRKKAADILEFITIGHSRDGPFLPEIILLGASTGGTEALAQFLIHLPSHCPPVLVVQHMDVSYIEAFAKRLASVSGLKLAECTNGEKLKAGCIYFSLSDAHLTVRRVRTDLQICLDTSPKRWGHRPSVDVLFESGAIAMAKVFAILFTGMGKDGATGLLKIRSTGGFTCAQDEKTSAVFGMPKEAILLNAAQLIGSPQELRTHLLDLIGGRCQ